MQANPRSKPAIFTKVSVKPNFLDTDAAVSLADSASRIEDDLSNLLVGPDASKTWRNIERVYEAVSLKLRDLRPLEAQTKEDLATLEKSLKEAGATPKESDSIGARLDKMIHRLGWSSTQDDKTSARGHARRGAFRTGVTSATGSRV